MQSSVNQRSDAEAIEACLAGVNAQQQGDMPQAIVHFQRAVSLAPQQLDVRLLLAYAEGASGHQIEARRTLLALQGIESMSPADARRVADAAIAIGADTVARLAVERALHFSPDDANLHAAHGALLYRTGERKLARQVLSESSRRWPTHVSSLMNYARLLSDEGEHHAAIHIYERVLAVDVEHHTARWYSGMLRLLVGDTARGWQEHEARRVLPVLTNREPQGIPAWRGESVRGNTVLLWGEQGLGDQMMGARFARHLADVGANVVVRCAASLVDVLRSVPGVSDVVADDARLPACDVHVPMLSVPALLGLNVSSYGGGAYIIGGGEHSAVASSKLRVAVAWAGSPTHLNDQNRSLSPEVLTSLLATPDVEWVSVQVGPRRSDLELLSSELRARIHDAGSSIGSFADTARVIASCNVVVTVDTSVAHLAGAMKMSTLVMLPYVPDWRWGLDGERTPWYDSVKLVRQPVPGDWQECVAAVHRTLADLQRQEP